MLEPRHQKIPVREEELGLINAVSRVCEVF